MIVVEQLTRQFGERRVLDGLNFTVRPGEVTGYLGPNGAGKSTTMKILTGLLQPTSGRVVIAGHDLVQDPLAARRVLGYVPESAALYSSLTANEYLSLVAELYHLAPARAAERIGQLLTVFDLTAAADRQIDSYSKGMRQKVLLAAALLHEPQVLLLDEPLNGLDVAAARALRQIVEEFAQRGKTVLYTSHILDVVERVCQRVIVLHQGRIVADAPTAELLSLAKQGTLEAAFAELTRSAQSTDWGEWKKAFFDEAATPSTSTLAAPATSEGNP